MSALEWRTEREGSVKDTATFTASRMNIPWAEGTRDVHLGRIQMKQRVARVGSIIRSGPREFLEAARRVHQANASDSANLAIQRFVEARLSGEYAGQRVTKLDSPTSASPDVFVLTAGESIDPNAAKVFVTIPRGRTELTVLVAAIARVRESIRILGTFEAHGYRSERRRV